MRGLAKNPFSQIFLAIPIMMLCFYIMPFYIVTLVTLDCGFELKHLNFLSKTILLSISIFKLMDMSLFVMLEWF